MPSKLQKPAGQPTIAEAFRKVNHSTGGNKKDRGRRRSSLPNCGHRPTSTIFRPAKQSNPAVASKNRNISSANTHTVSSPSLVPTTAAKQSSSSIKKGLEKRTWENRRPYLHKPQIWRSTPAALESQESWETWKDKNYSPSPSKQGTAESAGPSTSGNFNSSVTHNLFGPDKVVSSNAMDKFRHDEKNSSGVGETVDLTTEPDSLDFDLAAEIRKIDENTAKFECQNALKRLSSDEELVMLLEAEEKRKSEKMSAKIEAQEMPGTSKTVDMLVMECQPGTSKGAQSYEDRGLNDSIDQRGSDQDMDLDQLDFDVLDAEVEKEANRRKSLKKDDTPPGFDAEAGKTWLYPINMEKRDYQLQIVRACLFHNTLVCLPTGLGKTFIAAVVMYNFYRWYPEKKILFTAPTKPLVSQQIKACYGIMGIPREDITDMTGEKHSEKRAEDWKNKRVFFFTPDTLKNDLEAGRAPASDVRCFVLDECHKATGNHAFAVCVRLLLSQRDDNSTFRVIGLSASPGKDDTQVQQIVTNLQLSRVELRTEESMDVKKYTHSKEPVTEVVQFTPEILRIRNLFYEGLQPLIDQLNRCNAIGSSHAKYLTKGKVWVAWENFKKARGRGKDVETRTALNNFSILNSLFRSFEMLLQHGMRTFYASLKKSIVKHGNVKARFSYGPLKEALDIVEGKYSDLANQSLNMDATIFDPERMLAESGEFPLERDDNKERLLSSHPKLLRLGEILCEHFHNHTDESRSTRAMVFSQFRNSVAEIVDCLRLFDGIKPVEFKGQADPNRGAPKKKAKKKKNGEGETEEVAEEKPERRKSTGRMTQKKQMEIIRAFKEGRYNTLVSTSVAEEGLDIGEVDLIVCYDLAPSVLSTIQRFGRTGRKRNGKVVVLLTAGKEEQVFKRKLWQKSFVEDGKPLRGIFFNQADCRMVPATVEPVVKYVHVEKREDFDKTPTNSRNRKPSGDAPTDGKIKGIGRLASHMGFLSRAEMDEWNERFKVKRGNRKCYRLRISTNIDFFNDKQETPDGRVKDQDKMDLSTFTHWQDDFNSWGYLLFGGRSQHSSSSVLLVKAVQNCSRVSAHRNAPNNWTSHLNMDDVLKPGEVNCWPDSESEPVRKREKIYFEDELSQREERQHHFTQNVRDLAKKKVKKARKTVTKKNVKFGKRNHRHKKTEVVSHNKEASVEFVVEYRPKTPPITADQFVDLRSDGQKDIARRLDDIIGRLEAEIGSREIRKDMVLEGETVNLFSSSEGTQDNDERRFETLDESKNPVTEDTVEEFVSCGREPQNSNYPLVDKGQLDDSGLSENGILSALLDREELTPKKPKIGGNVTMNWDLGFDFAPSEHTDTQKAEAGHPSPAKCKGKINPLSFDLGFDFTEIEGTTETPDIIPPSPVISRKRKRICKKELVAVVAPARLKTEDSPIKLRKSMNEKEEFEESPVFNRSIARND